MKLLYSHPQLVVVSQMRSLLEREGLATELRNEYAAGAIGELAPIDAWPELWVASDEEVQRGKELLEKHRLQADRPDWHCPQCGSDSPASFDWCWQCGATAPDSGTNH